ncbi:MAG: hypothetical protein ACK532_00490, partial [Acidobacteriota bacterium]
EEHEPTGWIGGKGQRGKKTLLYRLEPKDSNSSIWILNVFTREKLCWQAFYNERLESTSTAIGFIFSTSKAIT